MNNLQENKEDIDQWLEIDPNEEKIIEISTKNIDNEEINNKNVENQKLDNSDRKSNDIHGEVIK